MQWYHGIAALAFLMAIHLFANKAKIFGWLWHGRFLYFASGLSFAYVFIDLLPALQRGQPILRRTFEGVLPYMDKHAYFIALLGVLFKYGLESTWNSTTKENFWTRLSGYIILNFFVGASVADSGNPEIQPLILFSFAMGMHYFVNDHRAREKAPELYDYQGRFILTGGLILGYLVGYFTKIPEAVMAVVISFLAGGVLLNVANDELPKRDLSSFIAFATGALSYTAILLSIGAG